MALKALFLDSGNKGSFSGLFEAVGDIPGVTLTIHAEWSSYSEEELVRLIQEHDILLATRSPRIPDALADDPGKLKYICYLHGTLCKRIGMPIIRSSIQVTNWGDSCGKGLAEGSMTLLMAVLRDLPRRILAVRAGEGRHIKSVGTSLSDTRIGIYGFGFAGREFARLLAPFAPEIRVFDPFVDDLPEACRKVESLEELFSDSHAIVIHAGLTKETENSVTGELDRKSTRLNSSHYS